MAITFASPRMNHQFLARRPGCVVARPAHRVGHGPEMIAVETVRIIDLAEREEHLAEIGLAARQVASQDPRSD